MKIIRTGKKETSRENKSIKTGFEDRFNRSTRIPKQHFTVSSLQCGAN